MRASLATAVACAAAAGARASAQVCAGTASFSAGRFSVTGAASFGDGGRSFGGNLAAGAHSSFFAGAGISRTEYNDVHESATDIGVSLGYQIPLGSTGRAQICPVVAYSHEVGPNRIDGSDVNASGNAYGVGAAVGMVVGHARSVDFIPSLALGYTSARVKYKGDYFGTPLDESVPTNYGSISLTAGLVLKRNVSVTPSVWMPFGVSDATPSYGISLGFNFGSR